MEITKNKKGRNIPNTFAIILVLELMVKLDIRLICIVRQLE